MIWLVIAAAAIQSFIIYCLFDINDKLNQIMDKLNDCHNRNNND